MQALEVAVVDVEIKACELAAAGAMPPPRTLWEFYGIPETWVAMSAAPY
jgi:hypothetical protein